MALSSSVVWEVRQATGSDNNSGGFKTGASGTDYSQQASAQYALTGVTSAGAGNTVLTASAAADMVGNTINVISGTNFTAGLFEITSVSVGVSITCSTNAAGTAISTGVGVSGVMNIGGAFATLGALNTNLTSGNSAYVVGTFTLTSTITWNTNFSSLSNGGVRIYGYTTTRGDNGRFTVTSSTNSINLFTFGSSARDYYFRNVSITHTATTRGKGVTTTNNQIAARIVYENCIFDGCAQAIHVDSNTFDSGLVGLILKNCEIKNSVAEGVQNPGAMLFINCYVHDNGGAGIQLIKGFDGSRGPLTLIGSILYNNGAAGVLDNSQNGDVLNGGTIVFASHCAFVSNHGSGLDSRTQPHMAHAENCIFYDNGQVLSAGYGWSFQDPAGVYSGGNNAYGNNFSGAIRNQAALPGDVTLTADPFTNKGSGDFSLNSAAGGGALCKQAGFPGTLIGGGAGFANIGPLDPASGGSSTIFAVECNTSIVLNRGGVAGY
jgi:hypothetical protein